MNESLMNDVNNLFDNTHLIIIYVSGVLCGIIYIANEEHHVRTKMYLSEGSYALEKSYTCVVTLHCFLGVAMKT